MSASNSVIASSAVMSIVSITVMSIGMGVVAYFFPFSSGTTGSGLELSPDSLMTVPYTLDPVEAVVTRLEAEEGLRLIPYDDSLGFPTICYGTKLPLTPSEREYIGVDRDLAGGLTEAECGWLLRGRLQQEAGRFIAMWPPFHAQPFAVQVELVDASYQLGARGLRLFDAMLGFLEAGEYELAADDVLGTLWAEQTPARAEAAAAVFRSVS